jgi:hypothetical protein
MATVEKRVRREKWRRTFFVRAIVKSPRTAPYLPLGLAKRTEGSTAYGANGIQNGRFEIGYFGRSGLNGSLRDALRLLMAAPGFFGNCRSGHKEPHRRLSANSKKSPGRHCGHSRQEERSDRSESSEVSDFETSVLDACRPHRSSHHAAAIGLRAAVRHLTSVPLISGIACFAVAVKPTLRTKA